MAREIDGVPDSKEVDFENGVPTRECPTCFGDDVPCMRCDGERVVEPDPNAPKCETCSTRLVTSLEREYAECVNCMSGGA